MPAAAVVGASDAASKPEVKQPSPEELATQKAQLQAKKLAVEEARKKKAEALQAERNEREEQRRARLAEAQSQARANAAQAANAAPGPTKVFTPGGSPTVERVAECQRQSFFVREKCMWEVCNGKWGKDGCPSYDRN